MSLNRPRRPGQLFRPSSVTQTPADSTSTRLRRTVMAKAGAIDTVPGRTAREWFDMLQPILLGSRPMVRPAERAEYPKSRTITTTIKAGETVRKSIRYVQSVNRPPVFGKPTFRNVIDENGNLV